MIITPTTIVLGAGASMPYGMPSGEELRSLICRNGAVLAHTLQEMFHIDTGETIDFTTTFLRSNVASIDTFLSKRNHFTRIGKLCIAATLCAKENQNELTVNDVEDHWYYHLWQSLIDGAQTSTDLPRNRIRFITFNYDRSLEYFIHQATKHTFGVTDEEAIRVLRKIEILHVYGALGEFHYKPEVEARPYSSDNTAMQIDIAANGIRVIPEARVDEDIFRTAREWFDDSEIIGFLGFGFDALNVKRLGLSKVIEWRIKEKMPIPSIIVSTFEKTEAEIKKIQQLLCQANPGLIQPFNDKNAMTLRKSNLLG